MSRSFLFFIYVTSVKMADVIKTKNQMSEMSSKVDEEENIKENYRSALKYYKSKNKL